MVNTISIKGRSAKVPACRQSSLIQSWCGVKGSAAMLTAGGASATEIDVLLDHEMGSPETNVFVRSAARATLAESLVSRIDGLLQ